jgi:hypothetical protein
VGLGNAQDLVFTSIFKIEWDRGVAGPQNFAFTFAQVIIELAIEMHKL